MRSMNEIVENEEEAKTTVANEACRYCKSFFNLDDNPVEIGLALCPARRDQQLDCKKDIGFDADTYFEAFYKESMGDYLFFAEEVDPLSKPDVDVLKGKDRNALSPPLCSECSDDFYWPLARNQVFSFCYQMYLIAIPAGCGKTISRDTYPQLPSDTTWGKDGAWAPLACCWWVNSYWDFSHGWPSLPKNCHMHQV